MKRNEYTQEILTLLQALNELNTYEEISESGFITWKGEALQAIEKYLNNQLEELGYELKVEKKIRNDKIR